MSRMLQALKQIEAKEPRPARTDRLGNEPPAPVEKQPSPPKTISAVEETPPRAVVTRSIERSVPLPEVLDDINRVIDEVNKVADDSLIQWDSRADVQWVNVPSVESLDITMPTRQQEQTDPQVVASPPTGDEVEQPWPPRPAAESLVPTPNVTEVEVIEAAEEIETETEALEAVTQPHESPLLTTPLEDPVAINPAEELPVEESGVEPLEPPANTPPIAVEEKASDAISPSPARQDESRQDEPSPPMPETDYSPINAAADTRQSSGGDNFQFSPSRYDEWIPGEHQTATELERDIKADLQDGILAAQYRRLVEAIRTQQPGDTPSSILLAGSRRDVHVAEVAAYVAAALASAAAGKVLLIDANSALSERFEVQSKEGLSEILAAQAIWTNVVRPTAIKDMDFLPGGTLAVGERDAWSARLAKLLDELKRSYRYVMMAGGGSDEPLAQAMSRACDAVYLLVHLGLSQTADAKAAVTSLRSSGARLLGCVVTNVPSQA